MNKPQTQSFVLDPNLFSVSEGYLRLLDRRHNGGAQDFAASGFKTLDRKFPGLLHDGHLIIVGGRPGSGKSIFCQQVAEAVAVDKTVIFATYEMSKLEIAERSIARRSGISLSRLRVADDLKQSDFGAIIDALAGCATFLRVADDGLSINDLVERAARYPEELAALDLPPLGLVVVDYLQLIPIDDRRGTTNRALAVGEVSRSLKRLAQSLQVPVLAAAQINRETESRPDKRPHLGDLRESGSIEQDADLVVFLYRDELYNENSADRGMAEVLVRKNRHGATGMVKLGFSGERLAFSDLPARVPFNIVNRPVIAMDAKPVLEKATNDNKGAGGDREVWY
ncbi:replicative DNA helicase [Ferrovum myxofaciens]|uniref:DnaB-like helicase C-terminal domain-containing protein n=1 Tax=Ferrovum myxofaciens TaxID=416213 RepID=A0A9E6SX23_9PROT|nr:DnaB-like helicase C-terminal domain-containing protein [Ferrovum myxofaciens]QKE38985.1 MAG: DnaB-like helicase C-terminal domain-containing protein [Ferrovum myxofaciens]QWY74207.1 MAG: DnaB-like helicase C-terminal domain-containing protein [Ferrovum myxofaciens]QWY76959.1 MAG: DnaB-like helicase C-terminal domain-containing protein [Ferrovum myxofaciens]